MAVEYKKFLAEFAKIETAINAAFSDRKIQGDSEGNTKKLLQGAVLAIGDRTQELRANGTSTGTKLADFANDADVKKALDVANQSLGNFKAIETRKLQVHAAIKGIYEDLNDLAKRMDAEIADRKKKIFEPKSLPDMMKLAEKVKKTIGEEGGLKDESIKSIATTTNPKAGAMDAWFKSAVELEVKKSAAVRANAAASEAGEKFKPRLMKLRWEKASRLGTEAETAAKLAMAAFSAKNAAVAKAQVKLAVDKSIEMDAIVTDYSGAYSENKSFLVQNPDHDQIFKVVSAMTSLSNRVLKNVQAAQSLVK